MTHGPAGFICKHFEKVTDPRANRGAKHDLLEMIFMAITATICGADGLVRFGAVCEVEGGLVLAVR
jgi:DDE_Tnp_1-associated